MGAQNVVFCVVNDGQIVVNLWWKMPCKCGVENIPSFEDLFLVGPVETAGRANPTRIREGLQAGSG
jgi:hypothetical protein